jgi:hypothetical protein
MTTRDRAAPLDQPLPALPALGTVECRFEWSSGKIARKWVLGVIFLIAAAGFLALSVSLFLYTRNAHENPRSGDTLLFVVAIIATQATLVTGALGASSIHAARTMRGAYQLICADGLIQLQRHQVNHACWDEIAFVEPYSDDSEGDSLDAITITRADGYSFLVTDFFCGLARIRQALEQRTLRRLWESARDDFEAGRIVDFRTLRISKEGLRKKSPIVGDPREIHLAWQDVQEVTWRGQDFVTIRQKGQSREWFGYHVANSSVCGALLRLGYQRYVKGNAGDDWVAEWLARAEKR